MNMDPAQLMQQIKEVLPPNLPLKEVLPPNLPLKEVLPPNLPLKEVPPPPTCPSS